MINHFSNSNGQQKTSFEEKLFYSDALSGIYSHDSQQQLEKVKSCFVKINTPSEDEELYKTTSSEIEYVVVTNRRTDKSISKDAKQSLTKESSPDNILKSSISNDLNFKKSKSFSELNDESSSREMKVISNRRTPSNDKSKTIVKKRSAKILNLDFINRSPFEDVFFNSINDLAKDKKNGIQSLIYTYPLFTDENSLLDHFINLKPKYNKFVSSFLKTLALELFPNGTEEMVKAGVRLDLLTNKLGITCNALNSSCLQTLRKERTIPFLLKSDEGPWLAGQIAKALTERDALLMSFSFKEIKCILQKENLESIKNIESVFHKTVDWIASKIIHETDPQKRSKLIEKFLTVADVLKEQGNFHGVMQFSEAFCKKEVSCLKPVCDSLQAKSLMQISDPQNDYKFYRKASKDIKISMPPSKVLLKDLNKIYEGIEGKKKISKDLVAIGSITKQLMDTSRFCPIGEASEPLKFFSNLSEISSSDESLLKDAFLEKYNIGHQKDSI